MNNEVFLSLLALDSYNRGYGENVGGLAASGSIGSATIVTDALGELDEQAVLNTGFYAIAYNWNGQKVISYRGTNFEPNWNSVSDFLNSPAVKDAWNGWSLGGGFSSYGPQTVHVLETATRNSMSPACAHSAQPPFLHRRDLSRPRKGSFHRRTNTSAAPPRPRRRIMREGMNRGGRVVNFVNFGPVQRATSA